MTKTWLLRSNSGSSSSSLYFTDGDEYHSLSVLTKSTQTDLTVSDCSRLPTELIFFLIHAYMEDWMESLWAYKFTLSWACPCHQRWTNPTNLVISMKWLVVHKKRNTKENKFYCFVEYCQCLECRSSGCHCPLTLSAAWGTPREFQVPCLWLNQAS